MKKAGMLVLLIATLCVGALGVACGDKPAANPTNPDGSGSVTAPATTSAAPATS